MMAVVGARRWPGSSCRCSGRQQQSLVRVLGAVVVVVRRRRRLVPMSQLHSRAEGDRARQADRQGQPPVRLDVGLQPVALQPKGLVFTFVDLGPRLITVTHHDAVAGPYHRNGQQIADVMNFFRGTADQAHAADRANIGRNYVLSCPEQLDHDHLHVGGAEGLLRPAAAGQVPDWLHAGALPEGLAVPDVEGGRLARAALREALLQAVDRRIARRARRGSRRGCG